MINWRSGSTAYRTKTQEKCFVGRMPCSEQGHYNAAALDVQTGTGGRRGVHGAYTHKFADTAEIPGFQSAGDAGGKKHDDAVRAPYGWNLEPMNRFITRLAALCGRHLWRNKAIGSAGGILLLKIARKSAVWLENVRNVKERIFYGTLSWMERTENILPCLEMILPDISVRESEF